jgi:hypothetical protein
MQLKLTNQQIIGLTEAIAALDGAQVTEILDQKPVTVFKGFRLAHAARWALARNAGRLQTAIGDFHRARSALIRQHAGGDGAISPAHPRFNEFAEELGQLAGQPVELELDTIRLADLRMAENEQTGSEYPIAVLNALQALVEG